MARLNLLNLNFGARTHEGAPARNISSELQLRRSVLACLLWESQFYEDGVEIAGRIAEPPPCGLYHFCSFPNASSSVLVPLACLPFYSLTP